MSRPNEKAPALATPGRGGRLMGFDMTGLDISPLALSAQLIAARHSLTIERAALVAVLALGGAHG